MSISVTKYSDLNKLRILFKTFFAPQFKYCSLTWMFHSKNTNNKVHELHYKLLKKDKLFTIVIYKGFMKLHKAYNNLSQNIFSDLYTRSHIRFDLSSHLDFAVP